MKISFLNVAGREVVRVFFFCFVVALKQTGNRKTLELNWIQSSLKLL